MNSSWKLFFPNIFITRGGICENIPATSNDTNFANAGIFFIFIYFYLYIFVYINIYIYTHLCIYLSKILFFLLVPMNFPLYIQKDKFVY